MSPTETAEETAKTELLAEVSDRAGEVAEQWGADADQAREFLNHYFLHVDAREVIELDADELLGGVVAHLELARHRPTGTTNVRVWWPTLEDDGWENPSAVIQVVHQDLPFLVDTVTMEVLRQGWQLRQVVHPQFLVRRDAEGSLLEVVHTDRAGDPDVQGESWIHVDATPPLGAEDEAYAELERGLREALGLVTTCVDDWGPMRERLQETIRLLQERPVPYSFSQVRSAMELLEWLGDEHFTFLGYREYRLGEDEDARFQPVPGTGLGLLRGDEEAPDAFQALPPTDKKPSLVMVTKDSTRSRVHRPVDLDYVGVRLFDEDGEVIGERRFLGLFAATAYTDSVNSIPGLADKAREILEHSGYSPDSHGAKAIQATLESYPRDELFQTRSEHLAPLIESISRLRERRQVRLFLRRDFYGRYVSCLVFLPRDRYVTRVRTAIERILLDRLGGESLAFSARSTESLLARLHFVVRLGPDSPSDVDVPALEAELAEAARSWEDRLAGQAQGHPEQAELLPLAAGLSEGYKEDFTARQTVLDLAELRALKNDSDMRMVMFVPDVDHDQADLRLKVFRKNATMSLSEVLPHLSLLGVDVIDERPYEFDLPGLGHTAIYDFGLHIRGGRDRLPDWTPAARERFNDAFRASFTGRAEADRLNGLVTAAGLTWQEVSWLRLIARYLKQVGVSWSQESIAKALLEEVEVTGRLMRLFRAKFDPDAMDGVEADARALLLEEHNAAIISALDEVASLEHDRIIRAFLSVINATVRTNAFRDHIALACKILPQELSWIPEPRPAYEIFVCSPILEGVHLRFGEVARGGLRWSDRRDDFRTEVLGLVKAQMVKNAVIVPVGAKGGFCPKKLPDPSHDRRAWQEAGKACYRVFINALLDVTDNLVEGEVVPPEGVLRYDDDDPYLVVAADKGTATFSDTANEIAVKRGFWLGDAFASGGSAGYDHKGMGITARGAWVSVQRHFREMGIDTQNEEFTCVGVGDMSGDVFGNGMLLSRHLKLVAAFNHQHVFLDPDPDPEATWNERKRLFDAGEGWGGYDTSLISAGGGVHPRTAKSIAITDEVREVLGLDGETTELSPTELISAILRAPVDLLWNGGIGTYVRASDETNPEVGDKTNDSLRVTGAELRCKAVGEGGNLGFTQRGRIEYARAGGRINTDFIDNSAGVDTSDHEVNIKILLADEVRSGRMSIEERNELLGSMTDLVAEHVLAHNYDQNLAMASAVDQATAMAGSYERWMQTLTSLGLLDRELEELPSTDDMAHRMEHGQGLTAPELATLLSYTKIWLEQELLASDLPDDPYLEDRLIQYFPEPLRERFADQMRHHRLHREIITTVAVNRFVNSSGATTGMRLCTETGAKIAEVVRAQLAARSIFRVGVHEDQSAALDNAIDASVQTRIRLDLRNLVERTTRWLLRHRESPLDVQATIDEFVDDVQEIKGHLSEWLGAKAQEELGERMAEYAEAGVPEELARVAAESPFLPQALPIVQTAHQQGRPVGLVTRVTAMLSQDLGLDMLQDQVAALPRQDRWDALARAALRDDLLQARADLTAQALRAAPESEDSDEVVEAWRASANGQAETRRTLAAVCDGDPDIARLSVGLRAVRSLLSTPEG
ncbi:NAD-glutamate dehydrogenase [Granulicoccus sp. GXG6511]|uniref:NAD-glutamate dehydrogenase n=1 Tax=Granulicoccus sp. GXG6511 TaxID=3381351 RepID=UPI003D7D3453